MSVDHEAAVLTFVLQPTRRRLAEQIAIPKRRLKALQRTLSHLNDLDPRYAKRIPPAEQTPDHITALLGQRGAPANCYVISEGDLDAKTMPLAEALTCIVGSGMGTLISCVPGRLGYFDGEDPGERYILERPKRVG